MKVLSLPKHENLTTSKKYCRKEEKLLLRSNFSSFPQYFRYISNVKSAITYKFIKSGCSNYFFLNSENLICRGTAISKCFREALGIRDNESRLYIINIITHNKYDKKYAGCFNRDLIYRKVFDFTNKRTFIKGRGWCLKTWVCLILPLLLIITVIITRRFPLWCIINKYFIANIMIRINSFTAIGDNNRLLQTA